MCIAIVAAVAALAQPASGAEPGEGILPPGDWSNEEVEHLLGLVDRTEHALPAFSDPATLEALGFHDFGVSAPGGYDHYINPAWIEDDHILDPELPEALVFQRRWDPATGATQLHLVSAMFILPSRYDTSSIPDDLAWMPGWHTHSDVCTTDDYRFAGLTSPGGPCPNGSRPWDQPPMLHVWIEDNPCGHRFGGIDVGGLHCDVSHGGGHDDPGDAGHHEDPHNGDPGQGDHGMSHDMDDSEVMTAARPAQPVTAAPTFTG